MKDDPEARARFVESYISKGLAYQIRGMREREGWSQQQLADRLESNQNSVYRLENTSYGKQTITTLRKVASVFDVALIVRFVPFSQLFDWVSGVPRLDPGFTPEIVDIPSFERELEGGAFGEKPLSDDVLDAEIVEAAIPKTEPQGGNAPIPISWGFQRHGDQFPEPVRHQSQGDRLQQLEPPPPVFPPRAVLDSQNRKMRATG
jgi:transcriptional regulator with XRE-family HTH domain